jgi:hypothetical protein
MRANVTAEAGRKVQIPSLEYLLGSRTVAYNWPGDIGVSFNCDF